MKKGHVGRPTNEEVAARKRKQLLKVLLPLILIGTITIMIISQTGLKGLMGDATSKKCEPCEQGWTEDGEQCYQETNQTSQTNAYILGDAIEDGIIRGDDYTAMRDDIINGVELDERKQKIYDIDGDGQVDMTANENTNKDLVKFNEMFSSTVTGGKILKEDYQASYVCPKETVTETTDKNNQIIKTTTTYKLNEQNETLCDVTTITKVTKNRVCTEDNNKQAINNKNQNKNCITVDGVTECSDVNIEVNCPKKNGVYVCGENIETSENGDPNEYIDKEEIKEDIIDEDEYLNENDEIENSEEEENDEMVSNNYNIKSNYLNYSDNKELQCDKNKKCLNIIDSNKYPIANTYTIMFYANYDSNKCTDFIGYRDGIEFRDTAANVTFADIRQIKTVYKYLSSKSDPDFLNKTKCIKIFKYDSSKGKEVGQSSITTYPNSLSNESVVNIFDKNIVSKEKTLTVSYAFVDKKNVSGKTTTAIKTFVELPNYLNKGVKGYSFSGWYVTRTKNETTEVLCKKNINDTTGYWKKTNTNSNYCNNLPFVLATKANKDDKYISEVSKYIAQNSSYSIKFVSRWTKKQKIKVNFQNKNGQNYKTNKNSSIKNVSLKLYTTEQSCKSNSKLKSNIVYSKAIKQKKSYTINPKIVSGQTYYLRIASKKATVKKGYQCQPIELLKNNKQKKVNVRFSAAIYKITYRLNGGSNNKLNPNNYTKKTKTFTLKKPSRSGYKFIGWYQDSKWKKKITKIKKGSTGNIILYARWSKSK